MMTTDIEEWEAEFIATLRERIDLRYGSWAYRDYVERLGLCDE